MDDAGFGDYTCSSTNTGMANDSCTAPANAAGELYVKVSGAQAGTGTLFTLDAAATTNPFFSAEGTAAVPLTLASFPYNGEVDTTTSYYKLSGLSANSDYRLTLSTNNFGLLMWVYGDAYANLDCVKTKTSNKDAVCISTTDGGGNLWLKVDGSTTTYGASYNLTAAAYGGQSSEGTGGAPIIISGPVSPRASTVRAGGNSYYKVTGLNPATTYAITLTSLNGPVDLDVYWDGFPVSFKCGGYQLGTNDETCSTTPDTNGNLYILAAEGDITGAGSTFTLSVQ